MVFPSHNYLAKHINVYGERTRPYSNYRSQNFKVNKTNNSSKKNGNNRAQNPLQIPLKVNFGPRSHSISWPFS